MHYNVPATVKKHWWIWRILYFTSTSLLVEEFLEFFNMETIQSQPAKNMSKENARMEVKKQHW